MNAHPPATALSVLLLTTVSTALAQQPPSSGAHRTEASTRLPEISLRYRFEHVSDAAFAEDADASTLRLRLNYGGSIWQDWSGFVEFDYVGEIGLNNFNSGAETSSVRRNRYPVVADPNGADMNQAYLDFGGLTGSRFRLGRQRLLLDNQRFVGGVGWRQNEQTYDGVTATFAMPADVVLSYSYFARVNRIFGEGSSAGDHNVNAHLAHGRIGFAKAWQLSPYLYYVDNEDAAGASTTTIGASLRGEIGLNSGTVNVLAEFSTQTDAANNPVNYNARYQHVFANWQPNSSLSFGIGYESLGGHATDSGKAFRTPLATLHIFQGWADQFLSTPDRGIDDRYVTAKYQLHKWNLHSTWHDFSENEGASHWGREIDLSASRQLGDRYSLLLKAAVFNASAASFSDTRKYWVQLAAKY